MNLRAATKLLGPRVFEHYLGDLLVKNPQFETIARVVQVIRRAAKQRPAEMPEPTKGVNKEVDSLVRHVLLYLSTRMPEGVVSREDTMNIVRNDPALQKLLYSINGGKRITDVFEGMLGDVVEKLNEAKEKNDPDDKVDDWTRSGLYSTACQPNPYFIILGSSKKDSGFDDWLDRAVDDTYSNQSNKENNNDESKLKFD